MSDEWNNFINNVYETTLFGRMENMCPDYDFVVGDWGYWINWVKFGFKREKRLTSFLCQIGWLEIIREIKS